MPDRVFNRPVPGHSCAKALQQMLDSGTPTSAVACSFKYDGRVSKEREDLAVGMCSHPVTRTSLAEGIAKYFEERVRTAGEPDFVVEDLNGVNIVQEAIRSVEVVRFLNVNGLFKVFSAARTSVRYFEDFPDETPESPRVLKWIDDRMKGSDSHVRSFVQAIIDRLNHLLAAGDPFHPCWVTSWDEFRAIAATQGLTRSVQLTGVDTGAAHDEWWIALVYRVHDAGTLARPTILDANWSALHFPSPPWAARVFGGHCMDLAAQWLNLVPEFVHQQIPLDIVYWENSGNLRQTVRPPNGDLVHQRQTHRSLLAKHYGDEVLLWIPRCV